MSINVIKLLVSCRKNHKFYELKCHTAFHPLSMLTGYTKLNSWVVLVIFYVGVVYSNCVCGAAVALTVLSTVATCYTIVKGT